jgi:23S rRNA pseudouridine955/2504/2580 synthase
MPTPPRTNRHGRVSGPSGTNRPAAKEFAWTRERILFEDEWLIAVDKPAGLPTQPTLDESRACVFGTLTKFLRHRDGNTPYLGSHHRLDRDTSGVLLFSKDRKANAGIADLFAAKTMQKTYNALAVAGAGCPDRWDVENYLGTIGRVGKSARYGAVRSGGDPARTSFQVLERLPGALWIEAMPHTGRTHQIRVHLAEGGHPIYGDAFYDGPTQLGFGPDDLPVSRVLLHAAVLEFPHPVTRVALKICSPLPQDIVTYLGELRQLSNMDETHHGGTETRKSPDSDALAVD